MIGIYILGNKINNKHYVGQSCNIEHRLKTHKNDKRTIIDKAIKKYGINNFNIKIAECKEKFLDFWEKELIWLYNSLIPNGYNLMDGGQKNKHHNQETKNKISIALKGISQNKGINNPMYGTIAWNRGKKASIETRNKLSIALKNKTSYWKDKSLPFEMKEKIKKNNALFWLGKKRSIEFKNKISLANHKRKGTKYKINKEVSYGSYAKIGI